MPALINPLLDALPDADTGRNAAQVGLPWFEAGDYAELRRVMNDGAGLPERFEDWLAGQRAREAELLAQGRQVCRVVIRPREFVEWCDGFTLPNQAACLIYAAVRAKELRESDEAPAPAMAVRDALRTVIASAREADMQVRGQPVQSAARGIEPGTERDSMSEGNETGRAERQAVGERMDAEPLSPAPARLERRYAGIARWE
jgi:hypothetical protein